MKKMLSLLLFSVTVLAASAQTQMVRQTRFEGKNITGVSASSSFQVEIYQSDNTSATIEIPAELEENVIFSISNEGVVTLGMEVSKKSFFSKENIRKPNLPMTAKIYVKSLKTLRASSSARIKAMTPFTGSSVQIGLSSSSQIENLDLTATGQVNLGLSSSSRLIHAKINAPALHCDMSSSSKIFMTHTGQRATFNQSSSSRIEINGRVEQANISTSSSAAFLGGGYNIGKATLSSSSSSKIIVGEVQELSAIASSSSAIRYQGDPKVTRSQASSSGSIRKTE